MTQKEVAQEQEAHEEEIIVDAVPAPEEAAPADNMVTVISPSTLQEGYTFPAQVDGRSFTVTVPAGGVKEGQSFQVPYPSGSQVVVVTNPVPTTPDPTDFGPKGQWKNSLLSCLAVCCDGLFWQSWCCNPILQGQLAQRRGLDLCGNPTRDSSNTCQTIGIGFAIYLGAVFVGLGFLVWPFAFVYFIILGMNIRYYYRQKYEIKESCFPCCDGRLDDLVCTFCCQCCVSIQMARHTHDEKRHPYDCCSATGLNAHAPSIV